MLASLELNIQVGENRRHIRELTDDILRTLAGIADIGREHEDTLYSPVLLSALGNLKIDMIYVLSICCQNTPVERVHQGFRFHIKAWMNRDSVEKEIRRLKEHVNKCYLQFTTLSAARTEHTSVQIAHTALRLEQSLVVNNVENQVRLRRLEGMMAQLLLETQFGQHVVNQTIEIIASVRCHQL
ncbi:hypothetical protein C8R44DRAFT_240593 [Mycena epipterygia]|nr:hypothetical protein C8R44DRAFT_240593 [Mycena epipterygia]